MKTEEYVKYNPASSLLSRKLRIIFGGRSSGLSCFSGLPIPTDSG